MAKYDQVIKKVDVDSIAEKVGISTVDEIVDLPTVSIADLPTVSIAELPTVSVEDFPTFYKRFYPSVPTESYVAGRRKTIAAAASNFQDEIADLTADKYLYGIIFAVNTHVDGDYVTFVSVRTALDVERRKLIENIYLKAGTTVHRVVLPIPELVETGEDVQVEFTNSTAAANTLWWDLEWLQ